MPAPPRLSVIIPTRGRLSLLQEAVASIRSQQSVPEIVVVDDGSADDTRAWLGSQDSAVRAVLNDSPLGPQESRNRGLGSAAGAFVKFLDDDDVLLPGTLARELAVAEDSGCDIVVSGWEQDDPTPSTPERHLSHPAPEFSSIPDDLLAGKAVPTAAALYRRQAIADLRWDRNVPRLDDWDWFVRAALRARRIVSCEGAAYHWRWNPRGVSSATARIQLIADFYAILAKLEAALRDRGWLTPARERRLAQYLYKEVRWLARLDPAACRRVLAKILALDRRFRPRDEERSRVVRVLCRAFGVRTTVLLLGRLRRGSALPEPTA